MKKKGIERTEQLKAERLRKKKKRFENMKPGTKKTMVKGFMTKSGPLDVMKEEYYRRKHEREKKREEDDS